MPTSVHNFDISGYSVLYADELNLKPQFWTALSNCRTNADHATIIKHVQATFIGHGAFSWDRFVTSKTSMPLYGPKKLARFICSRLEYTYNKVRLQTAISPVAQSSRSPCVEKYQICILIYLCTDGSCYGGARWWLWYRSLVYLCNALAMHFRMRNHIVPHPCSKRKGRGRQRFRQPKPRIYASIQKF